MGVPVIGMIRLWGLRGGAQFVRDIQIASGTNSTAASELEASSDCRNEGIEVVAVESAGSKV